MVGFKPGEVPAVLHRGETVRTPAQEAALRSAGGKFTGATINIDARGADRAAIDRLRKEMIARNANVRVGVIHDILSNRRRGGAVAKAFGAR